MIARVECGSLRSQDVGREVQLCGWVAGRRDHGGLLFFDVRDRWGLTQVVANPGQEPQAHTAALHLRDEYVVRVTGRVVSRPAGSENPRLPTGEVEVVLTVLEVLASSLTPPFPIEDATEADEKLRLRYRYLDLRRPRLQRALLVRHRVNKIIHEHMDRAGYVEVETPILGKSTPAGARDFLVPSRLHPGRFFALPQAPQTYKQLLMVSGLGRYYQIARCFRDENLRADRQLEFTQLDVEMSFGTEEDVFDLVEGLLCRLWKEVVGVDLDRPFPRLGIREALLRYGTDKPDLRFDLEIADLGGALAGSHARIFTETLARGGVIRGLAVPGGRDLSRRALDELVTLVHGAGAAGLTWLPGGPLDKFLTAPEVAAVLEACAAGPDDLVLVVADRRRRSEVSMGLLRAEIARRRGLVRGDQWRMLWIHPTYLFEEDDEGNLTYAHHPFTRPVAEDVDLAGPRPYDVRAHAYDVVCNGYELGGGSLRIYERTMQERIFGLLGLPPEVIEERFGFLLEAFEYGVPPHGGIALGLDRVVMLLCGTDNIRDVVAFPKTQSHQDLMTGAPAPVDAAQLTELGLQLRVPPAAGAGV